MSLASADGWCRTAKATAIRALRSPASLLVLLGFVLAACAGIPGRAGPPRGAVAGALRGVLPYLASTAIPVYLPGSLPPPPPRTYYCASVQASRDAYSVTIAVTNQPVSVNGPATVSMANTMGWIRAGPAGSVSGMLPTLAKFTAQPQSVRLSSNVEGTFYPSQGIAWSEGGWRFVLRNDSARPKTPEAFLPAIMALRRTLPASGNPIGPGTHGWVVQSFAADNGDFRILWTNGSTAYYIRGHGIGGIALARSLVRVVP